MRTQSKVIMPTLLYQSLAIAGLRPFVAPVVGQVSHTLTTLELGIGGFEPSGFSSDPYKAAASQMFAIPVEKVTPDQRTAAKRALYRHWYTPKGA